MVDSTPAKVFCCPYTPYSCIGAYIPYLKSYLKNLPKLLTTLLGNSPPRNLVTEQPAQVLLKVKTGGYEKFLVGIAHPFRNHRARWNEPNIQPTILHSNQDTGWGHSDQEYYPLRSLKSGTDIISVGYGRNIDTHTWVNPQGTIRTVIPYTKSASNCNIFDSVRSMSDLAYMISP